MASISISSVTAPAYTTAANVPGAGVYYVTPKFPLGQPPWFSDKDFKEVEHEIPNVGIGTTRMGNFGPRIIRADLIFVDTTTTAAMGRYLSAVDVFSAQARYTITIRGTSLTGCKILKGSTRFIGQIFMAGKAHLVYGFAFKQLG